MKRKWKLLDETVAGAVGGLAGAAAMSGMMFAGKKMGIVDEPLLLHGERELEERMDVDSATTPTEEKAVAQVGHFGLGALFGIGYRIARDRFRINPLLLGPLYGLALYRTNLAAVGPALDLTKEPWNQEDRSVVARRVAMHALYGAVVGLVSEALIRRSVKPRR